MIPVDNALNPAWRDTIVHLIVNEAYPVNTPADIAANITEDMSQTAYKLRELAPDSGAYINEVRPDATTLQISGGKKSTLTLDCSVGRLFRIGKRLCTAIITRDFSRSSMK